MYRILIPLDGSELSERAVAAGYQVAQALAGTIELVTVLEEPVLLDLTPGVVLPDRFSVERYLESVAKRLPSGVTVTTAALRGSAVDEILEAAAQQPDTIIVMSTHGRGGLSRVMFGSVADKITRGANCPVALVRSTDHGPAMRTGKILVPLDGSELAEGALPLAKALAAGMNNELHLLRVTPSFWNGPYVGYGPEAIYLNADQIAELTEQAQEDARGYLDDTASRLRGEGARVTWEARIGRPADEIVQVVETVHPAMIVMTSHGRSGFRRWALGSVADEVLHRVLTPIVVVPATSAREARHTRELHATAGRD